MAYLPSQGSGLNKLIANQYENGKLSMGWDGNKLHYFFNGLEVTPGKDITGEHGPIIDWICSIPDNGSSSPKYFHVVYADGYKKTYKVYNIFSTYE